MSERLFPILKPERKARRRLRDVGCESVYVGLVCMLPKDHQSGRASEPDLTDPRWHRAWNDRGSVEWVDG